VDKFNEAAKRLDKLLLKVLSEEKEEDAETRRLSNCAAARMLVINGEKDIKTALADTELATKVDPSYPKGSVAESTCLSTLRLDTCAIADMFVCLVRTRLLVTYTKLK